MKSILTALLLLFLTTDPVQGAIGDPAGTKPKPFKRALVISGGGITPGVGLGIIAGVEQAGWKPDVIITTCGASVGAAVRHSFHGPSESLDYARTPEFFEMVASAHVATPSALKIQKMFNRAFKSLNLPQYFSENILHVPQDLSGLLPRNRFHSYEGGPRIVIVAARAHFSPADVGTPVQPSFTQVYFTDEDTASKLRDFPSSIRRKFPLSRVDESTATISSATTEEAVRGSIADPFLISPGQIDGSHYMTGAVDLYPIETALALADEVVATYPASLFLDYENQAIERTFGFSQNQSALHAIQETKVKWIDISGIDEVSFTPKLIGLWLKDQIPSTLESFRKGINRQIRFGLTRAQEALRIQKAENDVRTHLRRPINKALLNDFTCKNAYEWKTNENQRCLHDWWPGCSRQTAVQCTPIR